MNRDVTCFVKSCTDCQLSKTHRHTTSAFKQFDLPKSRFRHVHIDLVVPLSTSNGNRYLLTMVDRYSRWPEAVPLTDMLAETVAKVFCNTWVARFGVPETISTDQGRQFESHMLRDCLVLYVSVPLRIIPRLTDSSRGFTVLLRLQSCVWTPNISAIDFDLVGITISC